MDGLNAPGDGVSRAMPEPGQAIGAYELIRSLGSGGMGEVFLARDTRLGRRVALKVVNVTDAASGRRFLDEARATARCEHEHIVVIHEADVFGGWHYLVLEYLQGQPLTELMREHRAMSAARAVQLIVPVVKALGRAHAEGLVHCDLKPDNVFVTDSGTVKVLDFGLAQALVPGGASGPAPGDGTAYGTRAYMAPEQWAPGPLSPLVDLWAVGVVLFRMLSGRHPLLDADGRGDLAAVQDLERPMPSLASVAVGVAPGLVQVVDRCLRKRPAERPQSAAELLALLEPFDTGRILRELKAGETPYTGLASFQEADSSRFFGRAREMGAFLARMRAQPLMAVVGASGAGKSSFVRAGVIPALKRSGEPWRALVLRPSRRPVEQLAEALLALDGRAHPLAERDQLVAVLRREPGQAGALARAHARASAHGLVVFVDQFEELFTLGVEAADRQVFTTALSSIGDDATSPTRVVLSLRSDFLGRVGEDQRFIGELSPGLFFLSTPARDALREALVQPAELAGYTFEDEALLADMLATLEATPGALPLLQFTASKLWDARDQGTRQLSWQSYRALGGVTGALAAHADRVMAELPPRQQALARGVLLALVTPERTRAVASLAELRALAKEPLEVEALVDQLVRARLLVVQAADGSPTVELVHESLISGWPHLRRWLDEGREDQAFREQLRTAARQWDARGRPSGLVWRGEAMDEARLWHARRKRQIDDLPEREAAFVLAVLAEGTRATRLRRRLVVGVIVALSLVVAGGTVSLVQVRAAEQRALAEADRASREAERAGREAARAREAESRATEGFERLQREQAAKAQAEAALEQGRGDLKVANAHLREALQRAETESDNARSAADRASELAASLQVTNDKLKTLLDAERKRAEQLERERRKITTELK